MTLYYIFILDINNKSLLNFNFRFCKDINNESLQNFNFRFCNNIHNFNDINNDSLLKTLSLH